MHIVFTFLLKTNENLKDVLNYLLDDPLDVHDLSRSQKTQSLNIS